MSLSINHDASFYNGRVISNGINVYAQTVAEDGLACIESVLCLLNVVSMWIIIYIVCYLVNSGKGM